MPIFEYVCQECEHEFEELVQGTQQLSCPECHSEELTKKFSGFAVASNSGALAARAPVGPCGTCGDPRGAGACAMN